MISHEEHCGDITFVTVSDTGVSHRVKNIPNQDSVGYMISGDDFVLVLSDGVGSCKNAELGSNAAVLATKKVFSDVSRAKIKFDASIIAGQLIGEWKKILDTKQPDECCTTLKAAMKIGNRLMLFSVGDGLLALTSGELKIYSPDDENLFVNLTNCLCDAIKPKDFWTAEAVLQNKDMPFVVFVCSDGVANGIQEGREMEMVIELETAIPACEIRRELETLMLEISEYCMDDRTIGVIKYERKNEGSVRRDNY